MFAFAFDLRENILERKLELRVKVLKTFLFRPLKTEYFIFSPTVQVKACSYEGLIHTAVSSTRTYIVNTGSASH